MATLTASTFAKSPRYVENGVVSVSGEYNAAAALEASAQTIFLCKIPNKATVLDFVEHHTTGATSCPVDYGIDGTLSAFASQVTQGGVNRLSVGANVNYQVSLSDDAVANYAIFKATPTLASSTTSFKLRWTITYTMDK
jgi:hypothetical protein